MLHFESLKDFVSVHLPTAGASGQVRQLLLLKGAIKCLFLWFKSTVSVYWRRLSHFFHLCQKTRGLVFPSRLHLLRLYYDPVSGARVWTGDTLGLKFGTQLDWTLLSNSLAQRSVLPFMHMVNLGLLFHQSFPGERIMENKIWGR